MSFSGDISQSLRCSSHNKQGRIEFNFFLKKHNFSRRIRIWPKKRHKLNKKFSTFFLSSSHGHNLPTKHAIHKPFGTKFKLIKLSRFWRNQLQQTSHREVIDKSMHCYLNTHNFLSNTKYFAQNLCWQRYDKQIAWNWISNSIEPAFNTTEKRQTYLQQTVEILKSDIRIKFYLLVV